MLDHTPWWWHDRDETFTVATDLLAQLHITAMENGAVRDAVLLSEAWVELIHGPWQRGTFVLAHRVPYAFGVAWVDELLARLQELTWDKTGRRAITRAHHYVSLVAPSPPDLVDDHDDDP